MAKLATPELNDLELNTERAAELLSTMSNKNRLLILCRLVEGEVQAGALSEVSGLSQSALSQHLAKLRQAGIVSTRRDAQMIYYRLASPEAEAILKTLHQVYCG